MSLTEQKKLENRPTFKGNSYFIMNDCVNQETESLLTVDLKSIFSPKPSTINVPIKSQRLGEYCDQSRATGFPRAFYYPF